MKIIVCGGRDYIDQLRMFSILDDHHRKQSITLLVQGGALGADTLAKVWADCRCVPCETVGADWKTHGRAAGPMRNAKMLTYMPDLVIAFPGGRGTANMVKQSRDAGVTVIEVEE